MSRTNIPVSRRIAAYLIIAMSLTMTLTQDLSAQSSSGLPVVEILGKPYYCYESKKGDSLFGIAKQYGWDFNLLSQLNPNVGNPITAKMPVYYPAQWQTEAVSDSEGSLTARRVTHTVQSGETIYSISRTYGVPMDVLYAYNPGARSGIKSGETLIISEEQPYSSSQAVSSEKTMTKEPEASEDVAEDAIIESVDESVGENRDDYILYQITSDDTIYSVAKSFDTRVEDIYRLNPGLTPGSLVAGETIRLVPGTRALDVRSETTTEERLVNLARYRVKKGDTWASIARSHNVDEQLLRDANRGKWKLRKDDLIAIPVTEEVEVSHEYTDEDPRESTPEGQRELYEEVHGIDPKGNSFTQSADNDVRVAIVLEDVSSNRDMEFVRGALLAAGRIGNSRFKTTVTVIDGSSPMSKVLTQVETFTPDIIISTSDKNLPQYLADYSKRTGTMLVNAFDMRSEAYMDTPGIYQFLTPSAYFNDIVAQYVADKLGDATLLIVGDPSPTDTMLESIKKIRQQDSRPLTAEEYKNFEPAADKKYLVYGTYTSRDDVSDLLEVTISLKENYPLSEINVLGRPNWITFIDKEKEKMTSAATIIPSRFYFDASDPYNRLMIDEYKDLYTQTPMKSYPVYSVTGYDILTYFVPNLAETGGDMNATLQNQRTLQSEISVERVSNWGGMFNPNAYMLEFSPFGIRKQVISDK